MEAHCNCRLGDWKGGVGEKGPQCMDKWEVLQPLVWGGKDEEPEEELARSLWVGFAPISFCIEFYAKAQ